MHHHEMDDGDEEFDEDEDYVVDSYNDEDNNDGGDAEHDDSNDKYEDEDNSQEGKETSEEAGDDDDASRAFTEGGTGTHEYFPDRTKEMQALKKQRREANNAGGPGGKRQPGPQGKGKGRGQQPQPGGGGGKKKLPEFNTQFIKKYYKKIRDHEKIKPMMDKFNIKAGTKLTAAACGFDYVLTALKPKYANPKKKLDCVVELLIIDTNALAEVLFGFLRKVIDLICKVFKKLLDKVVEAADKAGLLGSTKRVAGAAA